MKSQTEAWNTPACGSTAKPCACLPSEPTLFPWPSRRSRRTTATSDIWKRCWRWRCEERDRHAIANRIRDAQLPRMKTLEEFDFAQAPQIPAARIRELAEGG